MTEQQQQQQMFTLSQDTQGRLILHRPGEPDVVDVTVRRSFPWSNPGHFVSIRSNDGKELTLIDDLAQLASDQRELIERLLGQAMFIPRITRVRLVDVRFGYQQWTVATDRGEIEFRVQEREDIRFHPDGRFSIKDADGNIYELPRLDHLDPESRRAVEAIL